MYTFLEKKYYIPIYNIKFNVDFQEVVGLNLFESLILAIPEKYNLHEKKLSKKHLMGNAIRFENLAQLVNLLRLEPNLFRISLENLINNGAIEPIEIGVNQDWLEKIKLSDIKITKDGIKFLKNKNIFLTIQSLKGKILFNPIKENIYLEKPTKIKINSSDILELEDDKEKSLNRLSSLLIDKIKNNADILETWFGDKKVQFLDETISCKIDEEYEFFQEIPIKLQIDKNANLFIKIDTEFEPFIEKSNKILTKIIPNLKKTQKKPFELKLDNSFLKNPLEEDFCDFIWANKNDYKQINIDGKIDLPQLEELVFENEKIYVKLNLPKSIINTDFLNLSNIFPNYIGSFQQVDKIYDIYKNNAIISYKGENFEIDLYNINENNLLNKDLLVDIFNFPNKYFANLSKDEEYQVKFMVFGFYFFQKEEIFNNFLERILPINIEFLLKIRSFLAQKIHLIFSQIENKNEYLHINFSKNDFKFYKKWAKLKLEPLNLKDIEIYSKIFIEKLDFDILNDDTKNDLIAESIEKLNFANLDKFNWNNNSLLEQFLLNLFKIDFNCLENNLNLTVIKLARKCLKMYVYLIEKYRFLEQNTYLNEIILKIKNYLQEIDKIFLPNQGENFVLCDTSYLLDYSANIKNLANKNKILIPLIVWRELDHLKSNKDSQKAQLAQNAIIALNKYANLDNQSINQYNPAIYKMVQGQGVSQNLNDDMIIASALYYSLHNNIVLYSLDKNLIAKAKMFDIQTKKF